ncbi:MAG TPA: PLP-dependent aspartate aminotransferase family protein [Candidatus Krumholzibacteria bacterium]|nr:PLP-dependent aspartate aminotransferase family protein [Candidatus Krumholzibacteria bacterium]
MQPTSRQPGPSTRLVHAGERATEYDGAVVLPVFRSAMYDESVSVDDQVVYIRYHNTPNHRAVAAKLAALEGCEDAVVLGSGMAAISSAVLSVVRSGDHVLAQHTLYGGTHALFTQDLPALGVEVEFVESDDPRDWNALRRDTTRLAYVEAISNPLLHVTDLEGIAEWARGAGLVSMIDATMTTPIGLQPTRMGFDLVVHSATKFLNGHSDIVAGAVLGSRELCRGVLHKAQHLGGSLDPDACAQLMRGMKTLALRWERQCATALDLARWLHEHPRVERVLYPGLASHPSHRRAEQWLNGFGALFAFDVGDAATARSLQDGLEYFTAAPSFGGVESLITRPAHTSHALLGTVARAERGIGDGLLRVAVGVEDVEDLRGDLQRALETL